MSTKDATNPIELDVSTQMMNDRIGFQYESIMQSNNGTDVLQQVLDANALFSDTQVELGIDIRELYQQNATQTNIASFMTESYSLILPNRNSLDNDEDGILIVKRDDDYLDNLKTFYQTDVYGKNTRRRYPNRTLVGRYESLSSILSLNGYWRSSTDADPISQEDIEFGITGEGNVTVNTQLRSNNVFVGDNYETGISGDVVLQGLEANVTVDGSLGAKNIYVTENIQSISDIRLKKNIKTLNKSLETLKQIEAVSFDWRNKNIGREIGFIAQNVEKVIPELVHPIMDKANNTEYLTVNYLGFIPVLLNGIKEQQIQIEELRKQLDELKNNYSTV